MRRALTLPVLLGLCAGLANAAPVLTKTDDGVIDWTARMIRAVGVGTPQVLSPTGALTPREPYDVARADAEKRIARVLARIPVDARRRLRDLDPLDARRQAVAKAFTADDSRHFADGTVHLPASASFAWVAAEWPEGGAGEGPEQPAAPLVGPPLPGPTGLVIKLDRAVEPTVRLRLETPDGKALPAGTHRDPLGPRGIVYATRPSDVDLAALVGDAPLTVTAAPGDGRGALVLADETLAGLRLPGAVLVLMPEEAP